MSTVAYLRLKTVKGEKYAYLVRSVWDPKKNTSRQETIKYLGKASQVTEEDIPAEYRSEPSVISFLASDDVMDLKKKEAMLSKLRDQLFRFFIQGDIEGAKKLYEDYRVKSGTASFFEKILTPTMYHIGNLWAKKEISIADEHVCSNVATTLVKIILGRNTTQPKKKTVLICTPEGEQHCLGASVLESYLSCSGFRIYNLSPSEPHESIVRFVESAKPDAVFVSVTLPDNIKPAQRLVKKIKSRSPVPIFVGGQAVRGDYVDFDADVIRDSNLKELPKLLNQPLINQKISTRQYIYH